MLSSNKNVQCPFDTVIYDSGVIVLSVNCNSGKITSPFLMVTGILMRSLIIVGLTFVFTEEYSNKNGM